MREYVAKGKKVIDNLVVCPVCQGEKIIAKKEKIKSFMSPVYQERTIFVICPLCQGVGFIERPSPPSKEVPITNLGQPRNWGKYEPLAIKLERGK